MNSTTDNALRWQRLGLALLGAILFLLPLAFWIHTHDQFELPKLMLLRLLSTALLGAWALGMAARGRLEWRPSPLDLPVLAWSAWLLAKTFHSVSPWVSWRGEYENFAGSLTQLNYSLLFFLSLQLARRLEEGRRLLGLLEASALAVAAYALMQAMGLDFIRWAQTSVVAGRFFASMGNPNFLGALMVMALALAAAQALFEGEGPAGETRALWLRWAFLLAAPLAWLALAAFQGPLDASRAQPGARWVLGAYALALAAAPALIASGRARPATRLLLAARILLLFAALAGTGTRGAFAGLLAVLAFYLLLMLPGALRRPGLRGWAAVLGVLAVAAAATLSLGPELRRRMAHTLAHPLQAFDESRMQIWIPAMAMWRAHPVSGTGVDTFKTVFPQYAASKFTKYDGENVASRMAHSEPLHILATLGIVGLALWLWMLLVWAAQWRLAWRQAGGEGGQPRGFLAGLAAACLGYLVQNLVSFGVSAITAPFFVLLALLWCGRPLPLRSWPLPAAARAMAWPAAAAWLAWGAWAATLAFRADLGYNFGHMVAGQVEILARSPLDDARAACLYALDRIQRSPRPPSPEQSAESGDWYARLREAESRIRATPFERERDAPFYRAAAQSLLYVVSTMRQEESVRLCPHEVKYRIYLGLAYEELYKRSPVESLRPRWFQLAEASYAEGIRLNPRNAYYHGNLGRLYGLRAERGEPGWFEKAEAKYLDAVRLAKVTRLFYENLILLYAQFARPEGCFPLLEALEGPEPALAARLYFGAATLFIQSASQPGGLPHQARLRRAGMKAVEAARRLDPANPDVAYTLGALSFYEGDKKKARALLKEALALDPRHEGTLQFMKKNGL